jgi:hypothetical protein
MSKEIKTINETKTFTLAGISITGGKVTDRVANGTIAFREKALLRAGHTDVVLIELPKPMTKVDAIAFFKSRALPVAPELFIPDTVAAQATTTAKLTPEQKLIEKRARDAKRKRAKRAADKEAKVG